MTCNQCYPCCMSCTCDKKTSILKRLVVLFLLGSELTEPHRLVMLSCVRSLLRALLLAICRLLKKWTNISQKQSACICRHHSHRFHGTINYLTLLGLTSQMSNVQNHNRIVCVIINWIDPSQFQPWSLWLLVAMYVAIAVLFQLPFPIPMPFYFYS